MKMPFFHDIRGTKFESRTEKKRSIELAPYKLNVPLKVGPPETELRANPRFR